MPSPAITAPLPATVLVPGPVTVEFTRCLACVEDMDTTQASIFDVDTEETIVTETLQPEDESWTPSDGTEPFELPEEGSFAAVVQHVARREQQLVAQTNDEFALLTGVAQVDSVPFFTGAASPAGSFCIVVADDDGVLDPFGECLAIDEPSAALIDPSGAFALSAGGVEIEYDAEVSAGGAISGSARADLDGNGSLETPTRCAGSSRASWARWTAASRSTSAAWRRPRSSPCASASRPPSKTARSTAFGVRRARCSARR